MDTTDLEPSGDSTSTSGPSDVPTTAGNDENIELLDLLVLLARGRNLLFWVVVACIGLGVVYGGIVSPEYKASAQVIPESPSDGAQGVGDLGSTLGSLQGLGINFGPLGRQGLSKDAYPEVLESREVRLAVVRDTFQVPNTDTTATLIEYFESTRGALSRFLNSLGSFSHGQGEGALRGARSEYPTVEEERAILRIQDMVTSYQNPQSGLMQISVTAGDPQLASQMVNSFIAHLSTHVRGIRTRKARENLSFIQQRFEEVQGELSEAEQRLADFADQNQNITTASLRTKRDRLERQVRFKSSLYSDLQTQLTQAELDLKRSEPVLTMVEKSVPPMEPVSPQWLLIIVVSVLMGSILGVGAVLVRAYFSNENATGERQAKIRQVRDAFYPAGVMSAVSERFGIADSKGGRTSAPPR
jgi:uncharacterized protein involved in exopolysaccharide biosynthesis